MAPEVVAGVEQGPPSDIWSLGCTILEMATGLDPWAYIPDKKLLWRVIQSSTLTPAIPETLSADGQAFLRKCLVRDPTKRQTTTQLLEDSFLDIKTPNPMTSSVTPTTTMARSAYLSVEDGESIDHRRPLGQIPRPVQTASNSAQDERLTIPEATPELRRCFPSSPESRSGNQNNDSFGHQALKGIARDSLPFPTDGKHSPFATLHDTKVAELDSLM